MSNVECFLTDEFVAFSTKMAGIYAKIKDKNENIKKILEQYKEEKAFLENEAAKLLSDWESKKSKE